MIEPIFRDQKLLRRDVVKMEKKRSTFFGTFVSSNARLKSITKNLNEKLLISTKNKEKTSERLIESCI